MASKSKQFPNKTSGRVKVRYPDLINYRYSVEQRRLARTIQHTKDGKELPTHDIPKKSELERRRAELRDNPDIPDIQQGSTKGTLWVEDLPRILEWHSQGIDIDLMARKTGRAPSEIWWQIKHNCIHCKKHHCPYSCAGRFPWSKTAWKGNQAKRGHTGITRRKFSAHQRATMASMANDGSSLNEIVAEITKTRPTTKSKSVIRWLRKEGYEQYRYAKTGSSKSNGSNGSDRTYAFTDGLQRVIFKGHNGCETLKVTRGQYDTLRKIVAGLMA